MLLTLSVSALRSKLVPGAGGAPAMALTDVPAFAAGELGLRGLALQTEFLVGADRARLTKVLECADKAGCPVLVLIESNPQPLASKDQAVAEAAKERLLRVAQAAQWLGCSAFSLPVLADDSDAELALVAERLKPVSRRAERLDLNLCIAPRQGLTATADRVTELLKKIGGFRVGTLPDFAAAAASGDPIPYLRRLVPYASTVLVPAAFEKKKPAKGAKGKAAKDAPPAEKGAPSGDYDMTEFVAVLSAVGYEGSVSLDYRGDGEPLDELKRVRELLAQAVEADQPALSDLEALLDGDLGEDEEPEEKPEVDAEEEKE